jgi:predicted enzyme involved in methoxymalonyl-ACP biosynthesis
VIICRPKSPFEWEIDTWLMSCRVLGRRVEQMVLREIVEHARRAEIRKLTGVFRPTDRNKLVEDHYAKLGFTAVHVDEDGTSVWELDVAKANIEPAPMTVRSIGFQMVEAAQVAGRGPEAEEEPRFSEKPSGESVVRMSSLV